MGYINSNTHNFNGYVWRNAKIVRNFAFQKCACAKLQMLKIVISISERLVA